MLAESNAARSDRLDELPGVSEVVCQQACALLPDCLAIDYSVGPEKMCELHKEPVLHVLPTGEHACRVKPAFAATPTSQRLLRSWLSRVLPRWLSRMLSSSLP